jgi:DNA mismatch endonuclease, patch repair protein
MQQAFSCGLAISSLLTLLHNQRVRGTQPQNKIITFATMDVLTKEQRHRNMQAIRSKDTKAEKILAKALWANGHRYRRNNKTVFGKPDFTFKNLKIAVFVDSEYLHGKDWETNKFRIKSNREFWWSKIEGNIKRDKIVSKQLKADGWKILRFWDTEIQKKLGSCILKIERAKNSRKKC